jgi:hemoglobin-like flavoprotein
MVDAGRRAAVSSSGNNGDSARGAAMNIQESVERVLQRKENLADLFYEVFLRDYPEVRQHFDGVNFRHQSVLLTMALMVMERHHRGQYPAIESYLKYLGSKHHDRGIPAESFPLFAAALLATLEQFHGADWNAELAGQWRAAIDRASATMLEGYRTRFSV